MNTIAALTSVLFSTFPFLLIIAGVMCLGEETQVTKESGGAFGNGENAIFTTMHDLHAFAVDTQESSDDNGSRNGDHSSFHRRDAGMRHSSVELICNDDNDNSVCAKALEVLTSNDLGFAATIDEVYKMCPVLLDGLRCVDNYIRHCLTLKHQEYFNKLYAGTITVIKDLCNTRTHYRQEYIRHAPCMRKVSPKYNECSVIYHNKTAGLNHINGANEHSSDAEQGKNVIVLCCSFQEYLQCSERVVYETCGNEAALFTKDFLNRMAGPVVQFKCKQYTPGSQACEGAASALHTSPAVATFIIVLLLLIFSL